MLKIQCDRLQRYGFSVLSVLLALVVGLLLERLLKLEISPLFFAAVVFSGWYGGFAPGLVATVLAIFANDYFFLQPYNCLLLSSGAEIWQLIVFSLAALFISLLNLQLRNARQISEAELAKLQVSYRRLFETANEGIWIFNAQGQTEYVNQCLAEMLGYSMEQMLGRPIFDFMDPEAKREVKQWLEQQKQNLREAKQQFDLRLRHKDESEIWTVISTSTVLNSQGEFSGAIAMLTDITKHKQVEAALRESEAIAKARAQELETFMETVPAAVWIASDPECHHMIANRAAYELLRLPPGSLMTATVASGEYPFEFKIQRNGQDLPVTELPMQKAGRTNQDVEAEFQIVFAPNDVRSVYGKAVPIRDDSGAVRGVIGAFLDVTEHRKTEAALRKKQEWLDLAQAAAKIGSFEWNIQTNVNTWSKELEALYGLEPGEFGGTYQDWKKWIHPDDLAKAEADIRHSLQSGELFTDWRVIWKDGSVHWLHARAKVFYDRLGQPLKMIGINFDITDRKQAEIALRASESRFRRIVDSNIIGVFFGDLNGKITHANDAFLQMVGYNQEDLLAGKLNWRDMTPPEHLEQTEQAKQELELYGACSPFEKEFFCKDGSRVFVVIAAALFEDSPEQGFACVIDITDRKQAEAERDRLLQLEQAARAEAEAANRIKDDFLAIVSHELRSPLNPILGWSKLLLKGKLDAAKTTQALETIERNAKLQTRLIEDLLDVSRILRGKLSLNICAVDLVSTIEAALETVRLTAEAKSIQIHTQLPAITTKVQGDPNRLQQVVWNLLSNAVKFTPEGGRIDVKLSIVSAEIQKEEHARQTYAQIIVSDTGKGISPDFLPYVFDRFRQADEATTRKFGGLGLGLAIVRHIVQLHGGSIEVASPGEGLGATFTVTLPTSNACPLNLPEFRLPETSLNLQGVRIIIVDDDIDSLRVIELSLQQYGAQVKAVTSAAEALTAIAQMPPDVLLSDIAMPEIDGYMLIRQIRALEVNSPRKLPAIALTAFAGESNSQKIISAGFQKHLTKPVDPYELAAVIAELIRANKNN